MAIDAGSMLDGATHAPGDPSLAAGDGPGAEAVAVDAVASAAALADARAAVASMRRLADAAAGAGSWPVEDRREVLALVRTSIDGLGTVRGAVLVAEQASQAWKGTGAGSFERWVGTSSGEGKKTATRQIREAEQLDTVVEVTTAVTGGQIGLEHAKLIARLAAEGTAKQRAAVKSTAGQEYLIGLARNVDAQAFAVALARWAAALDPVGVDDLHEARRQQRFLHVAVGDVATIIKGQLDNVAGKTLLLALEALTPAPGVGDDRDFGQRHADALTMMAKSVLSSADTKPGAHIPVQVSFLLTEATWLAAKAARDARRASLATFGFPAEPNDDADGSDADVADGAGAGGCTGDLPVGWGPGSYEPATFEDGTPVPATALATALCDCELTRIVIDADGVPIDLGRSQRLYTGPQRRAVIARDRHCIWPGCTLPARYCDVHHLLWWGRDHGPTSVDNGALACDFHHHEIHRRDLTITRIMTKGPDGVALVTYRLTDPTGRRLDTTGRWLPANTPPPTITAASAASPEPPESAARSGPLTAAGPPTTSSPPKSSPPTSAPPTRRRTRFEPPDELDLTGSSAA